MAKGKKSAKNHSEEKAAHPAQDAEDRKKLMTTDEWANRFRSAVGISEFRLPSEHAPPKENRRRRRHRYVEQNQDLKPQIALSFSQICRSPTPLSDSGEQCKAAYTAIRLCGTSSLSEPGLIPPSPEDMIAEEAKDATIRDILADQQQSTKKQKSIKKRRKPLAPGCGPPEFAPGETLVGIASGRFCDLNELADHIDVLNAQMNAAWQSPTGEEDYRTANQEATALLTRTQWSCWTRSQPLIDID